MKNFTLIILSFLSYSVFAQDKELSDKLYNEGLKCFNNSQYHIADSLFSLSINIKPTKDAYFNRGLVRFKLNNENGYCVDMALAASIGDKEASKYFWSYCIKSDSVYYSILPQYEIVVKNKVIEIIQKDTTLNKTYYTQLNNIDSILVKYEINNTDTIFYTCDKLPEFSGGENLLYNYLSRNVKYPNKAREKGIQGVTVISFIVTKEGSITNVEIIRGHPDLAPEALRVIQIMPNWTPATHEGKKVDAHVYLPINFRLAN